MKKMILILLLPLFWQCVTGPSRNELIQMNDSLLLTSAQKQIQLNELIESINIIDENIQLIKEKEQIISLHAETGDLKGRTSEQINHDINLIYELMVQNKSHIQELEQQLKNIGIQNQRSNQLIASLSKQLEEKNAEIIRLQKQLISGGIVLDQLNLEIIDLSLELDALKKISDTTKSQLDLSIDQQNMAWYAFGSRRELRDQNILSRKGFLSLGSKQVLHKEFNHDYFNEIDIRETDSLFLFSSKADILTNHPAHSYKLEKENKGDLTLIITEPAQFWSLSRYLVIQVN